MSMISRVSAMAAAIILATPPKTGFQSMVFPHRPLLFPHNTTSFRQFSLSSPLPTPSETSHLAQAIKTDMEVLLKEVSDKNVIEEIRHILEMANRASLRREVLHTDFLTPPILDEAMAAIKKLVDVNAIPNGGYPEAERCRLSVGHPEVLTTLPNTVAALSITGNFGFQPSHRGFLGSLLGAGIAREKLGDIILQVCKVPVSCTPIPLEALEYEPPRTKAFKTVESSLRVDALASAGFKISRSKFGDLLSKGDVCVNWSTVTKNGASLKTGDMVSVRGKGRLKIGEINTTKKGKFAVELIRYL